MGSMGSGNYRSTRMGSRRSAPGRNRQLGTDRRGDKPNVGVNGRPAGTEEGAKQHDAAPTTASPQGSSGSHKV